MGWEYWSYTGSGEITYLMHHDGFVYIGTGVGGTGHPTPSAAGTYTTTITVDDDHIIAGTSGNDTLTSGSDADFLSGFAGADVLSGNAGDDVLLGGSGDDQLSGGAGSDRFVFTDVTSDGHDTITDFDYSLLPGFDNDVINLDALFDAIMPAANEATRLGNVDVTGGLLTITGYSDFSVILTGVGVDEIALFNNGNLVVDES
jgi:hypothetical protein